MRWTWVLIMAACSASQRPEGAPPDYPAGDHKPRVPGSNETEEAEEPVARPPEQGTVIHIEDGLVWIVLAKDETVLLGDTYRISRGEELVGHIVIEEIRGDQAAGPFREESAGPAAPPRRGDRARRQEPAAKEDDGT